MKTLGALTYKNNFQYQETQFKVQFLNSALEIL